MKYEEIKEYLKHLFEKLALLLNHFFPGIAILEIFFNKGYFSNTPNDIYEFILYILWAGILSMPYIFIHPFSIEFFYDRTINKFCDKHDLKRDDLGRIMNKLLTSLKFLS